MRVLVAPLNWGIGHATRSIPLIEFHLDQGNEVIIASSGDALTLLKRRFPELKYFSLPDYHIKYHKSLPVWFSVFMQSYKIRRQIRREYKCVQQLCKDISFDLILSDNRYGVHHKDIPSEFICHQLNPIVPLPLFQPLVERIHQYLCKPFNQILIPDYSDSGKQLSGILSKTALNWDNDIKFINPLSQLSLKSNVNPISGRILVLLSGIEPKRSHLENILLEGLIHVKNEVVVVGGRLDNGTTLHTQVTYHSFLDRQDLEREINQAEYIICRSGYSTIMDLHQLTNKTIVLIPTPGQTEQIYLAEYLSTKYKHFVQYSQNRNAIKALIENITNNY